MFADLELNNKNAVAFQLKGGLFTLTTLQVLNADMAQLKAQLVNKIQQAPNFFHRAPIVLDLKVANQPNSEIDFAQLKKMLYEINLIPVAIRNASTNQAEAAVQAGFAILQDTTPTPRETEKPKLTNTKLITEPVRSGQQIYAPDGDLIVVNQVSHGAELIADGNIHVYGTLRGRALAGVNGNQQARIFCNSLEAELVSVAGSYKMSEDIERLAWKVPAQIYIKQDRLQINVL